MNIAGTEFHVAVLAEWLVVESKTIHTLHHDTSALTHQQSDPFGRLVSAQYVLVDSTEWAEMPLEYGSTMVSLQGDHYTALKGGTPTVHDGHIFAYGSHV